jgi:FkbM family methyltransferase
VLLVHHYIGRLSVVMIDFDGMLRDIIIKVQRVKTTLRAFVFWCARVLGVGRIIAHCDGQAIWVHTRDLYLGRQLYVYGDYEPFESILFRNCIKNGMVVFDVGANIGYYTKIAADAVGASGKVIAFEPDVDNSHLLSKNIQGYPGNVIIEKLAVCDKNGEVELYRSSNNMGDHRIYNACDERKFNENVRRSAVRVHSVRLDDYVQRSSYSPAVIKMDIQGAETLALKGMSNILHRDVLLFLEFWPYGIRCLGFEPKDMLETLIKSGMRLAEIDEITRRLQPVDVNELVERFPDLGIANLLCYKGELNGGISAYLLK